jgi:hypothetical protein
MNFDPAKFLSNADRRSSRGQETNETLDKQKLERFLTLDHDAIRSTPRKRRDARPPAESLIAGSVLRL